MFRFHALEYKVMIFTVQFSPSLVVEQHLMSFTSRKSGGKEGNELEFCYLSWGTVT